MKPAHPQLAAPRTLARPGQALWVRADAVGRVAGARLDAPAVVGRLRPAVQELNSIERGQRSRIRNPPGKQLAHTRGREAAKGYDWSV